MRKAFFAYLIERRTQRYNNNDNSNNNYYKTINELSEQKRDLQRFFRFFVVFTKN